MLVHGPCFGAAKQACLAAASAFVLPSFSEGLPMAALEAMAHRLPCLLSPACNLPEAFDHGAARAVEPEAEALVGSLRQLLLQPAAEREAMGEAGQRLVAERFSWPQVAERTARLYSWLHGTSERPDWIEAPAGRANAVPGW